MPSFMIGIDEVFDAKIASGSSTTLSRAVNTSVLACSFSDDGLDDQLAVGERRRGRW